METVAYRGKRVKPLTVREVSEIREMRQHFEVMAVRRVVELDVDVEALWAPCRTMEEAAGAGDRDALIAADEAFHRTLIRLSDHHLLAHLWAGLYPRIHQIMSLRDDQDVDLADIAGAHPPIVKALEAGDVVCGVRLVSDHFHALADFDPASIAAPSE